MALGMNGVKLTMHIYKRICEVASIYALMHENPLARSS